jgi:biopolymer transport protein ExbD
VRKEHGNIMIGITENNRVWIDRRQVDVHAVRANVERLHAENPAGAVVIQADRRAAAGLLVQVIDQSRAAGVDDVSIAASVLQE